MPGTNRLDWLAAAIAALMTAGAQAQTTAVVLHNFGNSPPRGGQPNGVIRDSAGNLYGTTFEGGIYDAGVFYEISAAGQQTVLYNFGENGYGSLPTGSPLSDSAGNFYGATISGGLGLGTIYKLDTSGNMTVLYNFTAAADGFQPYGSLVSDAAGNLYGTSRYGGAGGAGVVFMLDTTLKLTVLYSFTGAADGAFPNGGLVLDAAGNLYGTTYEGGQGDCQYFGGGCGVVYRVSPGGGEEVLYSFTGLDSGSPEAGLLHDSAGNLYGTASEGNESYGVVFKLSAKREYTILHNFSRTEGPSYSGLIEDSAGNLYGNTEAVIFELESGGRHYEQLYALGPAAKGRDAYAGAIRDQNGNLYGSTVSGGPGNAGVVYELTAAGEYSVLYGFPNGNPDPTGPDGTFGGLVRDSAGNLYGTSFGGGANNFGTIYKLDATGHETVLYNFMNMTDGGYPWSGVTRDAAGNLYGTAQYGGDVNGVVYKLDASGQYSVLYTFTGGDDGGYPYASVTLDATGNIYGTTAQGGAANAGVVFKLDASGNETALDSFTGGADGGRPSNCPLILDADGNLYGVTGGGGAANAGVVFKVDPAGHETVLYTFTGGADGAYPQSLTRDPKGNLYGTAYSGGASNAGLIFMLDTARHETVLYNFTGGADGANPEGGLIRGEGGEIYGSTYFGGASNVGVVFVLNADGQETVLHSFSGADGAYPEAGVIRDPAGNFYGTTSNGGNRGGGVAFKIETQ